MKGKNVEEEIGKAPSDVAIEESTRTQAKEAT
jgi:hypothetical protein